MNIPPIDDMYRIAAQYSRRPEEVDDLVQDLLLEAVVTGKDFSDARFMAWGRGFLRNRAAFIARTEGRRRKREERFHEGDSASAPPIAQLPERFIVRLRPSLRIVARLVNCGLNRQESSTCYPLLIRRFASGFRHCAGNGRITLAGRGIGPSIRAIRFMRWPADCFATPLSGRSASRPMETATTTAGQSEAMIPTGIYLLFALLLLTK